MLTAKLLGLENKTHNLCDNWWFDSILVAKREQHSGKADEIEESW